MVAKIVYSDPQKIRFVDADDISIKQMATAENDKHGRLFFLRTEKGSDDRHYEIRDSYVWAIYLLERGRTVDTIFNSNVHYPQKVELTLRGM